MARSRSRVSVAGDSEARLIAATLGRDLARARRRRRVTQAWLATRIGITRERLSQIETGRGTNAPLELWVKLGMAVGRPLAVRLSRDMHEELEPRDAGHLAAQELVVRLARGHGRSASVELATRPWDPAHAADVVLRDDRQRLLVLIEIVNRAGDLGASLRASGRKAAELERYAIIAGGDGEPYRIAIGWLLVDSAANRGLIQRYPEVLRSRFGGSSFGLVRCLMDGWPAPAVPAIAWIDVRAGRIGELRWRTVR